MFILATSSVHVWHPYTKTDFSITQINNFHDLKFWSLHITIIFFSILLHMYTIIHYILYQNDDPFLLLPLQNARGSLFYYKIIGSEMKNMRFLLMNPSSVLILGLSVLYTSHKVFLIF